MYFLKIGKNNNWNVFEMLYEIDNNLKYFIHFDNY